MPGDAISPGEAMLTADDGVDPVDRVPDPKSLMKS